MKYDLVDQANANRLQAGHTDRGDSRSQEVKQ